MGLLGLGANHAPTIWEVVPGVVEVGSGGAGGNKWFGRFWFLLEAGVGSGGWENGKMKTMGKMKRMERIKEDEEDGKNEGGLQVTLTLPHTIPFPMQQSEMVILPTTDGVVGIGANHAPTIWEVVPGVVEVGSGAGGGNKWFGRFLSWRMWRVWRCRGVEAEVGEWRG